MKEPCPNRSLSYQKIMQSEWKEKSLLNFLSRTAAYLLKTKSISQSPNLLPTASAGRSLIDVLLGILWAEAPLYGNLLRISAFLVTVALELSING